MKASINICKKCPHYVGRSHCCNIVYYKIIDSDSKSLDMDGHTKLVAHLLSRITSTAFHIPPDCPFQLEHVVCQDTQ